MEISALFPALTAGMATWLATAAGAAFVFASINFSRRAMDILMGFAAGVMLAASCWCLLNHALHLAAHTWWGAWHTIPVALGVLLGAFVLDIMERYLPHACLHEDEHPHDHEHGPRIPGNILFMLAILLHNIPEGLALGVTFGAAIVSQDGGMLAGAVLLTAGICLHNIPVGMAMSLPMLKEGFSRRKAFLIGQGPGLVEPVMTVLGATVAASVTSILPYAMSFAAGAMIYVVVAELIPQSDKSGNHRAATAGLMVGFVLMMCLEHTLHTH